MDKILQMCELRANGDGRTISGRAIVFDSPSNDLGFVEIIHRNAISQELIDSCNILMTYNHNPDRILARRDKGHGNLQITVAPDGVDFEFNCPRTTLGNDVLEDIRCGNLSKCSFAFTIPDIDGAQKWEKIDGVYHREIFQIDGIYDLSIVVNPAYEQTYVTARNEELARIEASEIQDNTQGQVDNEEVQEPEKRECIDIQENPEETAPEDVVVEIHEENQNEEEINNTEKAEENPQPVANEQPEPKIETKNKPHITMEKRFSILTAIRNVVNNIPCDDITREVNARAQQEFRNAGLSYSGQIQIPGELRSNITVAAEGEDIVPTELWDVLGPIRSKNVLVNAGAKFLSGLSADVQIPIMGPTSVYWETETAPAQDGGNVFSSVTLSPKRLTAYVHISKQLLLQSAPDVENLIRQDLINALNSKLEATILGDAAPVVGKQPGGIFYNQTAQTLSDFASIAELESDIEDENIYGNMKWLVSPKFKAALRTLARGENVALNAYSNGELDGTPVLSTTHIASKKGVYGDWSQLVIGQFGGIDLLVDPYTQAKNSMIVLIIQAWFDSVVLRPEAFAFGEFE